jgi:hypothetical protein
MRFRNELIIILAFWALYGPFSLIVWYETGAWQQLDLMLLFFIGILIVLKFLLISHAIKKFRAKRRKQHLTSDTEEETPEQTAYNESSIDYSLEACANFRQLFNDTVTDLD